MASIGTYARRKIAASTLTDGAPVRDSVARSRPGKLLCVAVLGILSACSTLSSTPPVSVSRDQTFALLPFENLSITPQAETRLRSLVETRLRQKGVTDIHIHDPGQPSNLKALLNTRVNLRSAIRWANENGARYGVSGTVHEWQYNNGADGEPVVGMTLSLIDLVTGDVLWQANGARTGWGFANLSVVADKAVAELLQQVSFTKTENNVSTAGGKR